MNAHDTHSRARRGDGNRGFVLLVIMVILATATLIVAGEYNVVAQQNVIGVRVEEDQRARAIAEACLSRLDSIAREYMDVDPAAAYPADFLQPAETIEHPDFDGLLDPDGTGTNNSGDELLPPGTTTVLVPRLATAPAATTAAHLARRYRLVALGGGACLMRFEDNNDDGIDYDDLDPTATDNDEGPDAGVSFRVGNILKDRDRSIYLTAIGVYPYNGTDPDGAYTRAHARVTLRRLLAMDVPSTIEPAVSAGGNIDLGNGGNICGTGGIQSGGNVDLGTGNLTCVCGETEIETGGTGEGPQSGGCPACAECAQQTYTTAGGPPSLVNVDNRSSTDNDTNGPTMSPNIHKPGGIAPHFNNTGAAGNWRNNEILSASASAPAPNNNLGDAATCKFFFKDNGQVFLWDPYDTAAGNTLTNWASSLGIVGLMSVAGVAGGEDCTNVTTDPIPEPCTWTVDDGDDEDCDNDFTDDSDSDSDAIANDWTRVTVSCAAGQSPCWKLQADLDDDEKSCFLSATGASVIRERSVSDDNYRPRAFEDLPFVTPGRQFGTAGAMVCGQASTGTLRAMAAADWGGSNDALIEWRDPGYRLSGIDNDEWPVPAFLFMKNPSSNDLVEIKDVGDDGSPSGSVPDQLRITISTNSKVKTDDDKASICCATCNCDGMADNGDLDDSNGDGFQCGPEDWALVAGGDNDGVAIWSDDHCNIDKNVFIGGSVRCNTVEVNGNDACVTGDLTGYGTDTGDMDSCAGGYGAGACCENAVPAHTDPLTVAAIAAPNPSVCINNGTELGVVKGILGVQSVCGSANNMIVNAAVYTEANYQSKNKITINGLLATNGTTCLKNGATVNADPDMVGGYIGHQGASTFMEASW